MVGRDGEEEREKLAEKTSRTNHIHTHRHTDRHMHIHVYIHVLIYMHTRTQTHTLSPIILPHERALTMRQSLPDLSLFPPSLSLSLTLSLPLCFIYANLFNTRVSHHIPFGAAVHGLRPDWRSFSLSLLSPFFRAHPRPLPLSLSSSGRCTANTTLPSGDGARLTGSKEKRSEGQLLPQPSLHTCTTVRSPLSRKPTH